MQLISNIQEFFALPRLQQLRCTNIRSNNESIVYLCITDNEQFVIERRFCSVLSSFWNIFQQDNFYILIPDPKYLKTCIELKDVESLLECKKWLKYVNVILTIFEEQYSDSRNRICSTYNPDWGCYQDIEVGVSYLDDITGELLRAIPEQLKLNENLVYDDNEDMWVVCEYEKEDREEPPLFSKICSIINNYDMNLTQKKISQIVNHNPEILFKCKNMLDYVILSNSGVEIEKMLFILDSKSTQSFIELTAQNHKQIVKISRSDISYYVLQLVSNDIREIMRIIDEVSIYEDYDYHLFLLGACTNKYGSIENVPEDLLEELTEIVMRDNDNVYEYQRPFVKSGMKTSSPMMSILFPDIEFKLDTYTSSTIIEDITGYSPMTIGYSKDKFLDRVVTKYNSNVMSKLYELHKIGFITSEDIIDRGLHYIYAFCDWLIRKIPNKSSNK